MEKNMAGPATRMKKRSEPQQGLLLQKRLRDPDDKLHNVARPQHRGAAGHGRTHGATVAERRHAVVGWRAARIGRAGADARGTPVGGPGCPLKRGAQAGKATSGLPYMGSSFWDARACARSSPSAWATPAA